MKRIFLVVIIVGVVLWIGGYLAYRFLLPGIVADAILSDTPPSYIPKRVMARVNEFREPLNNGMEETIETLKKNDIPLEKLLDVINQTDQQDIDALVKDLKSSKPKNTDQVFDVAKRHFHGDFDLEILRSSFTENLTMKKYHQGYEYLVINQRMKEFDVETIRSIARQVLIEKYKELENKKSNEE